MIEIVSDSGPHSDIWYSRYGNTRVVNLKHGRPQGSIYIGRAQNGYDGYWGNPFKLGRDGNREEVLQKYDEWLSHKIQSDILFRSRLYTLRGKVLACFCIPEKCHGMRLAE